MPTSMNKAKATKMDEFYTLYADVEEELNHYKKFFLGKTIYCCCDNPKFSNFYKYFDANFKELGIKRLIASFQQSMNSSAKVVSKILNQPADVQEIKDGKIESDSCKVLFERADIIVTNPPFSKAKYLVKYLIQTDKKFIIVGNRNLITSDSMFDLFLDKKIKFGFGFKSNTANFLIPNILVGHYSKDVVRNEENIVRFRNVAWFTNLDIEVQSKTLNLTCRYDPARYPKYDNYDAINVDKICDIPIDYYGKMGVPITILDKFDYKQFNLLGIDRTIHDNTSNKRFSIEGKDKYVRVVIERKNILNEKISNI